jgi:hypothetical protein
MSASFFSNISSVCVVVRVDRSFQSVSPRDKSHHARVDETRRVETSIDASISFHSFEILESSKSRNHARIRPRVPSSRVASRTVLILSIASIGVVPPLAPSLALDALVDARAYPNSFRNMTTRNGARGQKCPPGDFRVDAEAVFRAVRRMVSYYIFETSGRVTR